MIAVFTSVLWGMKLSKIILLTLACLHSFDSLARASVLRGGHDAVPGTARRHMTEWKLPQRSPKQEDAVAGATSTPLRRLAELKGHRFITDNAASSKSDPGVLAAELEGSGEARVLSTRSTAGSSGTAGDGVEDNRRVAADEQMNTAAAGRCMRGGWHRGCGKGGKGHT
ncbi:hypothetical protein CYMTET_27154 [Cymbomonas tetramitiformis]|uniref:Secreted protein n=1 Tax=Cymbomonas tetramitiformis TaxID=36881 RepID=A0AAE0FQB4_9CHLO|nr:hypothetical protein CYMTET_27154 [Cymbomonas tetramitiformis]